MIAAIDSIIVVVAIIVDVIVIVIIGVIVIIAIVPSLTSGSGWWFEEPRPYGRIMCGPGNPNAAPGSSAFLKDAKGFEIKIRPQT